MKHFDLFMHRVYNERMFKRLGVITDMVLADKVPIVKFWCSGSCPPETWLRELAIELNLGDRGACRIQVQKIDCNGSFVTLILSPLPKEAVLRDNSSPVELRFNLCEDKKNKVTYRTIGRILKTRVS